MKTYRMPKDAVKPTGAKIMAYATDADKADMRMAMDPQPDGSVLWYIKSTDRQWAQDVIAASVESGT